MILLFTPLVLLRSALYLLPVSLLGFLYTSTPAPTTTSYHAHGAGIQLEHSDELYYQLGNVSYFTPTETAIVRLSFAPSSAVLSSALHPSITPFPVTFLRIPAVDGTIDSDAIVAAVQSALDGDDVFNPSWLETIVLQSTAPAMDPAHLTADAKLRELLDRYHIRRILLADDVRLSGSSWLHGVHTDSLRAQDALTELNGPYIASATDDGGLDVYPVYRLYPDTYRTFVYGMYRPVDQWAKTSGVQYKMFRKMDRMGNLLVPVPSRMYDGAGGALAGKRIGVKDLFDVKGVTTGAGSRAYAALYGDARKTASSLITLESLGGVFVGKTKTASFAAGSRGNGDTVDEQYPFSARGDGWQTCLGSSSGSGCAMGAYDWLDVGVGSDTGGSVRGPAAITGLYGNRPSTGAISLDGAVPMSSYADTAGILVRDPALFTELNRIWLCNSTLDLGAHSRTPQALHVPHNWIQQRTPGAQAVMVNFLARAQAALGLKVVDYPLDDILAKQGWTGDFEDPVVRSFLRTNRWGSWDQVGRRFKSEYRAEYGGQDPLLDPWIREMWEGEEVLDQELGKQEYAENVARMQEWSAWFHRDVLPGNDETCSDGILVYDTGTKGLPLYRENELNEGVIPPRIIDPGSLFCSMAGCVDYTIPIGQAPYMSLISKVEEQQPVTISLVARRGCDRMLLDFVDKLAEVGLIGAVKAGRTAF